MKTLVAAIVLNTCLLPSAFALIATNLSGFEGIEAPDVKYIVTNRSFVHESFNSITNVGNDTVRMSLRFRPGQWWDGDRDREDTSRQRAEVKGIGPHQKPGETFEYGTIWRTDPDFKTTGRFCHVFQLKATDGDDGAPLVTLSLLSDTRAAVRYWPGNRRNFGIVREFDWKPGVWQTIKIRVKTSNNPDGEILVSVNGDEFKGLKDVAVYRPSSTAYRPKWGLYRGVKANAALHDDYVEHKDASAEKLPAAGAASANSEALLLKTK